MTPFRVEEASQGNLGFLFVRSGLEPTSQIFSLHIAGDSLAQLRRIAKRKGLDAATAVEMALDDFISTDGNHPLLGYMAACPEEMP